MGITIPGFTHSNKRPAFVGQTVYGAGQITAASATINLLLVGLKHAAAGTITANGAPVQIFSEDEADTVAGAGGELARMAYQALLEPGVSVFLAAPVAAVGAVPATATITITATVPHAATGEFRYRVAGQTISGPVGTTDTQNTIATNITTAINGQPRLPVTASVLANVVTLTVKSAGIRGNRHILFQDTSLLPATVTSVIAGGAAVTGGGVLYVNGAGTEDTTALLATIFPREFGRIAWAPADATNAAAFEAQLYVAADPFNGKLQHGVVGSNDTYSSAVGLAQTTLNAERVQCVWMLYAETHPSEMAARYAAMRSVDEQSDPDKIYDKRILSGIAPQSQEADWASPPVEETALNNGITPLLTNRSGDVLSSRSITTKSLTNGVPDYRTLDTGYAIVPDFVRRSLELIFETDVRPNNPRVDRDPVNGERRPPAGVLTPSIWTSIVYKFLKDCESGASNIVPSGLRIVTDVDNNRPFSQYDPNAKRIMSVCPVITAPGLHQLGQIVREQSSA